jgi:hypothetical protein
MQASSVPIDNLNEIKKTLDELHKKVDELSLNVNKKLDELSLNINNEVLIKQPQNLDVLVCYTCRELGKFLPCKHMMPIMPRKDICVTCRMRGISTSCEHVWSV